MSSAVSALSRFSPLQRQHVEQVKLLRSHSERIKRLMVRFPTPGESTHEKLKAFLLTHLTPVHRDLQEIDARIATLQQQVIEAGDKAFRAGKIREDQKPRKVSSGLGFPILEIVIVAAVLVLVLFLPGTWASTFAFAQRLQEQTKANQAFNEMELRRMEADPTYVPVREPDAINKAVGGFTTALIWAAVLWGVAQVVGKSRRAA